LAQPLANFKTIFGISSHSAGPTYIVKYRSKPYGIQVLRSWEESLARLAAYKAAHGDCDVPAGWAEELGLGSWVNKQRHLKRKLDRGEPGQGMTAARAARLTALGLAWDPGKRCLFQRNEAQWEVQLARLAAYKAAHGDCNVPRGWSEDPGLDRWVNKQRTGKRKLDRGNPHPLITAARVAKLGALGFVWEVQRGWEAQLVRLVAYKAAHGNCSVPYCWAEDPQLGTWVSDQRKFKKKFDRGDPSQGMTTARAARLEALGFAWVLSSEHISKISQARSTNEPAWEAQLARLAAYKAAHGDCSVPQGWAEDPRLGRWINTQRQLKRKLDRGEPGGGMTAERAAKLTAIGFVWEGTKAHPKEAA
jgi:hypothetical protein